VANIQCGSAWHRETAHGAQEALQSLWHRPLSESYYMDAATMSLELHERGNHAVRMRRTGQRADYHRARKHTSRRAGTKSNTN